MMRTESDYMGSELLPQQALYGIAALRSSQNFTLQRPFSIAWYKSLGQVKKACFVTLKNLYLLLEEKKIESSLQKHLSLEKIEALIKASNEISAGEHFDHFIVPAFSGGAGTSINMNINEIIANRAQMILGYSPGTYEIIDPTLHANIFQSTNDVVPTALKVAILTLLKNLEKSTAELRSSVEKIENNHRHDLRLSYTQLQAALPSTWGRLFSTYAESLSRDWWRISKCCERIKVVNLGGGATGSGLSIPRYFIFNVNENLARITGQPVVRADNLEDATANLDPIVEVHGIIRTLAVNLIKMSSDIRLLASDFHGKKEISIPALQKGSSIMPGKVNPVIIEYIISLCEKVKANDQLIVNLSSMGQLDLNAYLPTIGETMLDSLEQLIAATTAAQKNLINGLIITPDTDYLMKSPSIVTVMIPEVGYHKAEAVARHMQKRGLDILAANADLNIMDTKKLQELLTAEKILELGYSFIAKDKNA